MSNDEIFLNPKSGRYFCWRGSNRRYLCEAPLCLTIAYKKWYCCAHQYLIKPEIISEIEENGKIIQYKTENDLRYRRVKGRETWYVLCNFNDEECSNLALKDENLCLIHKTKQIEISQSKREIKTDRFISKNEGSITLKELKQFNVWKNEMLEKKEAIEYKGQFYQIFTDSLTKRRYYHDNNDNLIFICDDINCLESAKNNEFCDEHDNANGLTTSPKIIIIEKDKKKYEFKIIGNKRYKRGIDSKSWTKLCDGRIENDLCLNGRDKDGRCKSHNIDITNLNSKKLSKHTQEFKDKFSIEKTGTIGDDSEKYIKDIISCLTGIKQVVRIGQTGNAADIKYKFFNENIWRCLQVKTLTLKSEEKDVYSVSKCNKYGGDLLIVGINKEKNRFILIMSDRIPKSGHISFCFNAVDSQYKECMFKDKYTFFLKMREMMRNSREFINNLTPEQLKEKLGMERLKQECLNRNFSFRMSESYWTKYDCFIEDYKIQFKVTSQIKSEVYHVGTYTQDSSDNSIRKTRPYSEDDDIDFLIVEILDFPGMFYIIPKEKLIEEEIFSSANSTGKKSISIPPKNYRGENGCKWVLDYLDNWDGIPQS